MPLTPLGWKSPEGYDAVQDPQTGQRYYQTPQGQYIDPSSGAQVQPPGVQSGYMDTPTPGYPPGYGPGNAPAFNPNQPGGQPGGGGVVSGPGSGFGAGSIEDPSRYRQMPGFGYPQMPGYPGGGGGGTVGIEPWQQGGGQEGPGRQLGPMMGGGQQPGGIGNAYAPYQPGGQQGGGGGLTPLGWKSPEGYDAVQGQDGKRYYQTPQGQYLDPQTGAQVTPPGSGGGGYGGGPAVGGGGGTRQWAGGSPRGDFMQGQGWSGAYAGGGNSGLGGGPTQGFGNEPHRALPQPGAPTPASTMPQVPLPHQVNPAVWDSLSRTGRGLALGAAGAGGWDTQDYEDTINKSRPQGYARQQSQYGYAAPRSNNQGGF